MFRGEIFIPKKKPFLNLTLSEKLNWGSLVAIFIYCSVFLIDEKWNSSEINNYLKEYVSLNQIVGIIFWNYFYFKFFSSF